MKHSQSLPTTAWSTTQTWDANIPDALRACTNIGTLFTLILAIFLLGNTDVNAQTCDPFLSETASNCDHPDATNGTDNIIIQSTYVDVNGNGNQDTEDGALVDLTSTACGTNIYTGTIVSGGTYGFTLNAGTRYTFEVCSTSSTFSDVYPLMDLWINTTEPAANALELGATSGIPSNGCVTMTYTNTDNSLLLDVHSRVHGNLCEADWKSWTLNVSCTECAITCPDDLVLSANSDQTGSCTLDQIVLTPPTVNDVCDNTTISIVANSTTLTPSVATTLPIAPNAFPLTASGSIILTNNGTGFTAGTYTVVYEVMNCAGVVEECVQNVTVEAILACNDEVNVTLGSHCAVMITPDMILEGQCAVDADYTVVIEGVTGSTITEPGRYRVSVFHTPASGTGYSCWGFVNVEDKTGPVCTVDQEQFTGFCTGSIVPDVLPTFTDCSGSIVDTIMFTQKIGACGIYNTIDFSTPTDVAGNIGQLIGQLPANIGFIPYPTNIVTGFDLASIDVITYQVTDVLGNTSQSCKQYVYYWRPSTINAPQSQIDLACGVDITDLEAIAALNPQYVPNYEYPVGSGQYLPVLPDGHNSCNYVVVSEDTDLALNLCGGTKKVLREWTILDWCNPNAVPFSFTQIIKTVDTVAPVWTNCPGVNDLGGSAANPQILNSDSSNPNTCFYEGLLLELKAEDACSDEAISYSAEIYDANGNLEYVLQDLSQEAQLGFGKRTVIYVATDACGNRSECTVYYEIEDRNQPIAICDEFTTVSLTNTGEARICADNLDSGSYDNCSIVSRYVKRMSDIDPTEAIPFDETDLCIDLTCEDATNSPIMVVLYVVDAAGNYNQCMVQVEVQDKIGPFLVCPADVTITCTDDIYDPSLVGDVAKDEEAPTQIGGGYAYDNCTGVVVTSEDDLTNLACGTGDVFRTWTVESNGTTRSCVQKIHIEAINSFRVEFPRDTTITTCTNPNSLGDFGAPIISDDVCAQVGIGSTDVQFDVVSGACYKILRTWTVINWCHYSDENLDNTASGNLVPGTELTFDDDGDGYFRYTQVIKVQDTIAPILVTATSDNTVFMSTTEECGGTIDLAVDFDDTCTGESDMSYSYKIDIDDDGTFEDEYDGEGKTINDGTIYPYGSHRALFIVEDGCGNRATHEIPFSIVDKKAPSIACQHLSVTLMPGVNMIEMWASDYIEEAYVSDNCDAREDLTVAIIRASDSDQTNPPSPISTNITFDCSDLYVDTNNDGIPDDTNNDGIPDDATISADVEVEIWIGDTDGNWTFCTATTTVFANDDGCDPNPDNARVMVAGNLKNEFGNDLEDVTIEITSEEAMWDYTTSNDGHYEIDELPMYTNFTVTPENDTNPLNGVSTYDLVLLSQHILGINELDSPYTMIAADVNNNGTITTADIVELRQMILYITSDFQNNKSWRFVDANFVFPDQTNPFTTAFPEVRNLSALEDNAMAENFVGIKVGDLNGDAVANSILGAEDRNLVGTFTMKANDQLVAAGEEVTLTLTSEDLATVEGFQFTLNFDATALEFKEVGNSDLVGFTAGNFGYNFLNEGVLTASWNKVADAETANEVVELVFTAKDDITLSEVISLSSRYTKAEAYDADMNDMNVGLEFNTTNGTVITAAGFELYQNQPNPFSNETSIGFTLPEAAQASLTIYDVEGRELRVITDSFAKGYNQFTVDNKNLIGGVLYYRLDTPTHSATKKMIVIK